MLDTDLFKDVAQVSMIDQQKIFKSVHVYINDGELGVSIWLDAFGYHKAVSALFAAGWQRTEEKEDESYWRPSKPGVGGRLWLRKDVVYPREG